MAKTFVLQGAPGGKPLRIDYAKELNQEQMEVVLNGDGPCLVLAGAGSGKTRTVTYRVAYLLEQGVDPQSILLLTFTNKASKEMLERVERLLGAEAHGMWGGTFHAIANRLLRMYPDAVDYAPGFTILDTDDAKDLVKAILKDLRIDTKERRFPSPNVCLNIISYTRNVCGSVAETVELKYPNFESFVSDLEEIARRYAERKRASNAMDFDDLLWNLLRLLEDPVRGAHIASRFQYVLVDEFQDTNAIQARIVERLSQVHRNLLVVGDDAQSIYAFRGADVQNILNFPKAFPNATTFKLLTNYRSTPEILELANASLSHNTEQFQKELVGTRASGDKPSLIPCQSARQEAQYVAEQVLALRNEGTALANMAVLFRASSQSQQLELELLKRDIPYEYRGGQKFFERAHVKDVVAFLRVFQNPQDEPAWLRVLGLQTGIGGTTAATIATAMQRCPAFSSAVDVAPARLPGKAKQGWEAFCDIARDLIKAAPAPAAMIRAVAQSAYQDMLEREYPNWRERLEDLEQFALFAEGYDQLSMFLSDVSLYDDVLAKREMAGTSADDERMVLSTVHQAKGLEWDTVFLIHLADGAFPNRRALDEEGGVEEERRLFYVAVTRARRRLFLSYPLTMGFDEMVLNRPSQFLDEISPRLLERIELVSAFRSRAGSSAFSSSTPARSWGQHNDWPTDEAPSDGEAIIHLDRFGERAPAKPTTVWKKKT
jgi:DNA helicase-2/ATP-dependent DNA helicase PcrA